MIEFRNVSKHYRSNVGLEDVTVRINDGDFVFLVGPSGAGKSTFVRLILKEIDAARPKIERLATPGTAEERRGARRWLALDAKARGAGE